MISHKPLVLLAVVLSGLPPNVAPFTPTRSDIMMIPRTKTIPFSPRKQIPSLDVVANHCKENEHQYNSFVTTLKMSSSSSNNNLSGKVVAQRFIYRLRQSDYDFDDDYSNVTRDYAIEERQYYTISEDQTLEPLEGSKTMFLRGPSLRTTVDGNEFDTDSAYNANEPPQLIKKNGQPRTYIRIGPSLYKISNLDQGEDDDGTDSDSKGLGATVWDSTYAMILHIMENPSLIKGNVLELGSGVGIGGLLSCIGAGLLSQSSSQNEQNNEQNYQSIEDIAQSNPDDLSSSTTNKPPLPSLLNKLTLTDSDEYVLNKCSDNAKAMHFPPAKLEISSLDWKARVPSGMRNKYNLIIGSDCAYYFPLVQPLARTIAYSLLNSPYDSVDNKQMKEGTFLHVGPEHRENIHDLKVKLHRGYRMNTSSQTLTLSMYTLAPLILDSIDMEEEQLNNEVSFEEDVTPSSSGNGEGAQSNLPFSAGYVEYQNVDTKRFSLLSAYHQEDYDGFNGDFFFPAETGREGGYDGETDSGYGKSSGSRGSTTDNRGPWLG